MREALSRRQFVQLGPGAAVLLYAAASPLAILTAFSREVHAQTYGSLREKDLVLLRRLIPPLIGWDPHLDPEETDRYLRLTIDGLDRVIGSLAPAQQRDLRLLIDLLDFPWTRILLGLWPTWDRATDMEIVELFTAWQQSWLSLQRFAYQSLVQLIQFAWYGSDAGKVTAYPGPPQAIQAYLEGREGTL